MRISNFHRFSYSIMFSYQINKHKEEPIELWYSLLNIIIFK